jgi:hypothetical protein
LRYSLRNYVYEKVKQVNNIVDIDLLNEMNKGGVGISMAQLNKILLKLEILGLVTVRWIGKDKRRIELILPPESVETSA